MNNNNKFTLTLRERESILNSLKAGVTPRIGLQHIQVGRSKEVDSIISDIDCIANGGATLRFIVGEFGAGKTFFLQLIRSIALEKGLVTIHADLTPDRRLHGTSGQGRALYVELVSNISTRSMPNGGALTAIVERFINEARKQSETSNKDINAIIEEKLKIITDLVGGYDFSKVISSYWQGYVNNNEELKASAIRWLRGEFTTKKDALRELDVRMIVDDSNIYDYLKIISLFVRQAGYGGLLVCIDEMVTLYKLASQKSRLYNYDQILRIWNDCLQGNAKNIGFVLGGTPDFIFDQRKGLYSDEALHSRIAENSFAKSTNLVDYTSPTLILSNLTPEDLFVLLRNIREVFANGDSTKYLVPDDGLEAFLVHCSKKIGDAYFKTPRNTTKQFVDMLNLLNQHPELSWEHLVEKINISKENETDMPDIIDGHDGSDPDDLENFRL